MKVIIVVDDPLILSLLHILIQRRGHTVLSYSNPQECPLFRAPSCPCAAAPPCPDVILSDYNMPQVNGMEFLEDVRNRGCQCTHVAIITGKGLAEDDLIRMAKLDTRFFLKPVDFQQLYDWLDRIEKEIL